MIVILCLLAPVYSQDVAHIGPNYGNITGQIKVGGKLEYVLSLQGIPIGPTWDIHHYFLGADTNGRDVAVRLLYGGRSSLYIGFVGMLITMVFGTILGVIAGYFRGPIDATHQPHAVTSSGPIRRCCWASRSAPCSTSAAWARSTRRR